MQKITLLHECIIIITVINAVMHISISHKKLLLKMFCASLVFCVILLYHIVIKDKLPSSPVIFKMQYISSDVLFFICLFLSLMFFMLLKGKYE